MAPLSERRKVMLPWPTTTSPLLLASLWNLNLKVREVREEGEVRVVREVMEVRMVVVKVAMHLYWGMMEVRKVGVVAMHLYWLVRVARVEARSATHHCTWCRYPGILHLTGLQGML